jgi:hypothetical protein
MRLSHLALPVPLHVSNLAPLKVPIHPLATRSEALGMPLLSSSRGFATTS